MPGESNYHRWLRSLWLCLCDIFWAPINSFIRWSARMVWASLCFRLFWHTLNFDVHLLHIQLCTVRQWGGGGADLAEKSVQCCWPDRTCLAWCRWGEGPSCDRWCGSRQSPRPPPVHVPAPKPHPASETPMLHHSTHLAVFLKHLCYIILYTWLCFWNTYITLFYAPGCVSEIPMLHHSMHLAVFLKHLC